MDSFVVMEAPELRAWCLKVKAYIESYRRRERAEVVKAEMEQRTKSRWRRFWRRPLPVWTEVVAELEQCNSIWDWDMPYHSAGRWGGAALELAERCLGATEVVARVQMSLEDLATLKGWTP